MHVVSRMNALDDAAIDAFRLRVVSRVARPGLRERWGQLAPATRRELARGAIRCEVASDPERARWLAVLQGDGAVRRARALRRVRTVLYVWAVVEVLVGAAAGVPVVVCVAAGAVWALLTRELVRSRWAVAAQTSAVANAAVAERAGRGLKQRPQRRTTGVRAPAGHAVGTV